MFDNLREDASNSAFDSTPFYEDEAQFEEVQPARKAAPRRRALASSNGRFLGMTPGQRLILAIMLFFAVCSLGSMCLLIAGKISLF